MDNDRIAGNWKQVKGKVREQWGKLTDDDLDVVAGRAEQLVGRIQERYGIEKDAARREYDGWHAAHELREKGDKVKARPPVL